MRDPVLHWCTQFITSQSKNRNYPSNYPTRLGGSGPRTRRLARKCQQPVDSGTQHHNSKCEHWLCALLKEEWDLKIELFCKGKKETIILMPKIDSKQSACLGMDLGSVW